MVTKVRSGEVLRDINTLFLSDLHLGHRRVQTKDITRRCFAQLSDIVATHALDYLIVAGDVFDDGLPLAETESLECQYFIIALIELCVAKGIKLRVLSGTDSHDRGQSVMFQVLNNSRPEETRCDLRFIEEVSTIKEEDGSVWLYVPDNVHSDPEVVWDIIQEKMYEAHVERVDYTVTHGQYTHHVPDGVQGCHDSERYLRITRFIIDNGHIHGKSVYKKRFITNGSYDRLDHNEETPKGCWHHHLSAQGRDHDRLTFFENKQATYMVTVDVRGLDYDAAIEKVNGHIRCEEDGTPQENQFIRILLGDDLYGQGIFKFFSLQYPMIRWKHQLEKTKANDSIDLFTADIEDTEIPITPQSIDALTSELLLSTGKYTSDEVSMSMALLEEIA